MAQNYKVEDTSYATLQASSEGLARFQNPGFGLSIHWGLYSLSKEPSREWVYFDKRIPLDVYKKRAEAFNPTRFNAEEWADLMLETGQTFIIITSKHHEGYCLWDTALTDFKVTNSPFKRDILAELAEALHARGLQLHFYYSLLDWTHPAYRNDWPAYVDFYQGQIRELCTRFGEIGGFVFDGYWPRDEITWDDDHREYFAARGPWHLAETYDLIHELQPNAVIMNNHHVLPLKGEDYQVWELDLPGENTAGFNTTEIGNIAKACWWNLNTGWSYQPWYHNVKSADQLFATYQKLQGTNTVFMLNVGPRPFGDIHPEEQQVLRTLAQMMHHPKS